MCPKCHDEATSTNKCIRCGKPLYNKFNNPEMVNPNFDAERFSDLSQDDGTNDIKVNHNRPNDDDLDHDLINQILKNQEEG